MFLTYLFRGMTCESTSLSCHQCGKKSFWALSQLQQEQNRVKKKVYFISDISYVSYNIRLTLKGQLATFLYSRLAHKEATGNSAYFFEYKPHLTYSFKVACPSKEQVHEERVEVVLSSDQTFGQNVVQTFRQFFPHPSLILRCEA